MNAGTRVARIRKASTSTAIVRPSPNSFTSDTDEVAMPRNTIANNSAAAVTMRPVAWRPLATAAPSCTERIPMTTSHTGPSREITAPI